MKRSIVDNDVFVSPGMAIEGAPDPVAGLRCGLDGHGSLDPLLAASFADTDDAARNFDDGSALDKGSDVREVTHPVASWLNARTSPAAINDSSPDMVTSKVAIPNSDEFSAAYIGELTQRAWPEAAAA